MGKRSRRSKRETVEAESIAVLMMGVAMRKALERSGKRQADVAAALGVTRARISQMCAGTENLTVKALARFAMAVGAAGFLGLFPEDNE